MGEKEAISLESRWNAMAKSLVCPRCNSVNGRTYESNIIKILRDNRFAQTPGVRGSMSTFCFVMLTSRIKDLIFALCRAIIFLCSIKRQLGTTAALSRNVLNESLCNSDLEKSLGILLSLQYTKYITLGTSRRLVQQEVGSTWFRRAQHLETEVVRWRNETHEPVGLSRMVSQECTNKGRY